MDLGRVEISKGPSNRASGGGWTLEFLRSPTDPPRGGGWTLDFSESPTDPPGGGGLDLGLFEKSNSNQTAASSHACLKFGSWPPWPPWRIANQHGLRGQPKTHTRMPPSTPRGKTKRSSVAEGLMLCAWPRTIRANSANRHRPGEGREPRRRRTDRHPTRCGLWCSKGDRSGAWLGGGASLGGGGAQGGGHALRAGCGAVQCFGGEKPVRR